jgi:hypothetical protein
MATEIQTLPQNVNYEIWQGDTWTPGTITAYNGTATPGNEVNFTGYTAKMELRTIVSNDVVKTLTSPSSGIALTSLGVITLTMTASETSAIAAGEYRYDLQITSGAGVIKTYTYGRITVQTDTTANA